MLPRQRLEGPLLKYTNVLKGYQTRWFVLNPENGILEYHEREEIKHLKPRGFVNLTYSSVIASDEVPFGFTISSLSGLVLRLKANDAREREMWVNKLNIVADFFTEVAIKNFKNTQHEQRNLEDMRLNIAMGQEISVGEGSSSSSLNHDEHTHKSLNVEAPLQDAGQYLYQLESQFASFSRSIQNFETAEAVPLNMMKDLLTTKAIVQSTLFNLQSIYDSLSLHLQNWPSEYAANRAEIGRRLKSLPDSSLISEDTYLECEIIPTDADSDDDDDDEAFDANSVSPARTITVTTHELV